MMRSLFVMAQGRAWWYFLGLMSASMIGIALYYQHVLNEWPCVLCIQVRILFMLLVVSAALALVFFRFHVMRALMHLVVSVIGAVMIERSWVLLATERGWLEGECSINLGMPGWFAIDKWLPDVFAAWTSCGYSPVIAFGVTMAEILLLLSVMLSISAAILFMAACRKPG